MNIKMTSLGLALLVAMATPAMAADLTVNGEVVDSTCTVNIDGGTDVTMKKVALTDLRVANRIGAQPAVVRLACGTGNATVGLQFVQDNRDPNGLLLSDTTGNGAKGVGYGIYDADDNQVKVGHTPVKFYPVSDTAPVEITHYVYYQKTGAAADVTAGTVEAKAQMDVIYN